MPAHSRWLVVGLVVVVVEARMVVEEPAHIAGEVTVYMENVHMGPRDLPAAILHAPVSVYSSAPRPDVASLNCSAFFRTVALITSVEEWWDARDEFSTALALEECGALAVVRRQPKSVGPSSFLGLPYYYTDFDCCREDGSELGVGFLVGWVDDLERLAAVVEDGETVVVSLPNADTNPWVRDVYHHTAFVVVSRGVLPVVNALLMVYGCRALAVHLPFFHKDQRPRHGSVLASMRWFIVVALVMLIVAAGVRVVYCAACPFFSNANFPNLVTHLLINLSMPLQLPAVAVAAAIFRTIISVHTTVSAPSRAWAVGWVLVCGLVLALELFAGYKRGTNDSFVLVVVLSTVVVPVTVLVASVVFLSRGIPFLRRMKGLRKLHKSQGHRSKDPLRHIRVRFTHSIVHAAFGMVLQLVVLIVGASSASLFYSTRGFPTLWVLYYLGLTIAAFNLVAAFAPGVRVPLPLPAGVRRWLVRGARRAMPLALFRADSGEDESQLQSLQTSKSGTSVL